MDSCFLPIELCEKVMDALPVYEGYLGSDLLLFPEDAWLSQRALCACARTCRAWRVRAQYLLWTFPALSDSQKLGRLNTAIRQSSKTPIIRGLVLATQSRSDYDKNPYLSTVGELFMHSFPHLQSLLCQSIRFEHGPPLRVLRMRLPFFSSITFLMLWGCTFQSLRAMLDVVWACSNLDTLVVKRIEIESERCSPAGFQRLSTAVENLRTCRKLTRLWLNMDTIKELRSPANIGLSGVGRVFGYAVTELIFRTARGPEALISLLENSFPALRSIRLVGTFNGRSNGNTPQRPWLHVIAIGRPSPGILKSIVMETNHAGRGHNCCENAVGTSEEVLDSAQRLPELLPELAELVVRLPHKHHGRAGRHTAYMWNILPGMHDVLRFEYREGWRGDWKPYTVLPRLVPRLLDQYSDSDSDSETDLDSELD